MPQAKRHTFFHYLATALFYIVKSLLGGVLWIILAILGYFIFQTQKSPLNLIIGLPLSIIRLGLVLSSLSSAFHAIFSPKYNKAVCIICS